MAIQNEFFGFEVKDKTTGLPLSGALVELRKGATIYTLTEVASSAYYTINSIPTGKYSVFIDSVDTNQTMAVGSGQVAALGNEVDNIPVSNATEYDFQDPATYKTTIELDQVTNVAVPDPTASDANKVVSVDSSGNYELKTISTSGFDAIFEVATTADLVEALSAEFQSKCLFITNRDNFFFANNQTFETWGYCNVYGAGGSNGITFANDTGTTITFDDKAGAPGNTGINFYTSRVQFNDTYASPNYLNYTINTTVFLTNLNLVEGGVDTLSIGGTGSITYENLESTIPTNVTVSLNKASWNSSFFPTLQEVTDEGNTTTNPITAASFNGAAITSAGAGTNFLADDGTYKAAGGGQVDSITSSDGNIDVDSSDPVNPDINLFRFPNNKLASDAPDTYPEGYSYGLNAGSGGFPDTFGTHQTFKSSDATGYQTYTATNSNQQWLRTITASNTWGSFTEITAGLGAPLANVLSAGNTTGSAAVNYSSFSNASPSNGDVNRDVDEELVYRRSGRNMGLVGSDRAVSAITNMNSLTLAGFYVTTNSGLTNIPSGWAINYLHMLVIRHEPTSGAITQIAYNVGESGTAGSKTAIRNSFNGGSTWTAWAELGASGASGSFTSNDGKTITVTNGLITSIV